MACENADTARKRNRLHKSFGNPAKHRRASSNEHLGDGAARGKHPFSFKRKATVVVGQEHGCLELEGHGAREQRAANLPGINDPLATTAAAPHSPTLHTSSSALFMQVRHRRTSVNA